MTPSDSTQPEGTQTQPSVEGSDKDTVQPSSGNSGLTKADLETFGKSLLESVDKKLQSDKDRAVKKTNERLGSLEETLRPLLESAASKMAAGASVDDALSQVAGEQDDLEYKTAVKGLYQAIQDGKLSAPPVGNVEGQDAKTTEIVSRYEFEKNDVDANSLVQRFGKDPDRLDGELAKLALQRQKSPSSPSAPQGRTESSSQDLQAQFEKEAKGLRGNDLINLKMAYRKKGLDVN